MLELAHDRSTADLDSAAAVLAAVREDRAVVDAGEAEMLQAAVAWAAMHSVDSLDAAATVRDHGETGVPVAGPGAPLVGEFCVSEFAAAIGLPTEIGKDYLGEAVEIRYRLRRVWARVVHGDLPAWRARRVARATIALSMEAAGFVDNHVAHVAHKIRPAQLDRLVEEAIGRFMPEEADRRRRQAADGRCFTIDTRQPSLQGTSTVYGELDLADALDLNAAVTAGAQALADLGSTDSLDVRRAVAVGDLARRQLTLDLNTDAPEDATPDGAATRRPAAATTAEAVGRGCTADAGGSAAAGAQAAAGGAVRAPLRRRRDPRRTIGGGVRAGGEHPGSGARRTDPAVVRQPRRPDHRETGARPQRPHRRRGLRGPRPTTGTDHPDPPHLRVPLVHPTRPRAGARRTRRRLRPPGALRGRQTILLLQSRAPVPPASPGQDPRRLDLHRPRPRHPRLDQPPRLPVPPRPTAPSTSPATDTPTPAPRPPISDGPAPVPAPTRRATTGGGIGTSRAPRRVSQGSTSERSGAVSRARS